MQHAGSHDGGPRLLIVHAVQAPNFQSSNLTAQKQTGPHGELWRAWQGPAVHRPGRQSPEYLAERVQQLLLKHHPLMYRLWVRYFAGIKAHRDSRPCFGRSLKSVPGLLRKSLDIGGHISIMVRHAVHVLAHQPHILLHHRLCQDTSSSATSSAKSAVCATAGPCLPQRICPSQCSRHGCQAPWTDWKQTSAGTSTQLADGINLSPPASQQQGAFQHWTSHTHRRAL